MIYNCLTAYVVKSYRVCGPIVYVCTISVRDPRAVKTLVGRDVVADFDEVVVECLAVNGVLQQV